MIVINPNPENINHAIRTLSTAIADELFDLDIKYNTRNEIESIGPTQTTSTSSNQNENPNLNYSLNSQFCGTNFDISRYIPLWVVYEKQERISNGETTPISIFDFLQKYYNWLYCDLEGGGQYDLSQALIDLIDIEKTKREYYKRFLFSFVPGVEETVLDNVTDASFERFIKDIRKNLYLRKTNVDSIIYFFKTLFEVDENNIKIYFPKENILRLNGGKFYSDLFSFGGDTGNYSSINNLGGSSLNLARLQDSDWIQDFSYLLKTGLEKDVYVDMYKETLHPAGLRVVFEKEISDYAGPGEGEDTNLICEFPALKNYTPYRLGTTYSTSIGTLTGITLYGLTCCNGFSSGFTLGFTGPTYHFPNWNGSSGLYRFDDINIFDFFTMCFIGGFTSPNEGVTCTSSSCSGS